MQSERNSTLGGARRVLIVSDSYPPLTGGATLATEQLAIGMLEVGWEVLVVTSWQRGASERDIVNGIRIVRLRGLVSRVGALSADPHRYTPPPFADPELAWRLHRVIREFRPTLIHSYGWITYSVLAVAPRRVPVAVSARDYGYICPKRTLVRSGKPCSGPSLRKCLVCAPELYGAPKGFVATVSVLGQRRWLRSRMNALHSCSGYMSEKMDEFLLAGKRGKSIKTMVIPDFRPEPGVVSEDTLASFVEQLPSKPFILFVGALRLIKGVEILLEAYAGIAGDRPPLVLIGSRAPDTPKIGTGITVLHDWPFVAVLEAWRRCLFGVSPSVLPEPLGNVVHEGMSQGKAVIGTVPGGHGSMITDGVTGLLVPSGDVVQLRHAMVRLISDEELRERLGSKGKERAKDFTGEVCLPRFRRLYEETVDGSASRRLEGD